jgi:hypothetical protein
LPDHVLLVSPAEERVGTGSPEPVSKQVEGCVATIYRESLASTDPAYTETKLESHDIAFPTKIQGDNAVFRGALVCAKEVGPSQTKERLERLRLLDGGSSVFVVLLLDGDSSMTSLTKLQME